MDSPIELLTELRTHPERYHPVTNKQFDTFAGIMTRKYDTKKINSIDDFVKLSVKIVNDERIDKLLGWNVGIIYDKPWFQLSWKTMDGETVLATYISTISIGNSDIKNLDNMLEAHGVYHKAPSFKFSQYKPDNKRWTYDLVTLDEKNNGAFFCVILKMRQEDGSESLCRAKLYPIQELINYNKEHKKRWLGSKKDNEIIIHKKISKAVYEDLIEIRSKKHLLHPMTKRQWLDFNDEKIFGVLESDDKPCDECAFDYKKINVGGYTGDQLRQGYQKAKDAGDEKATNAILELLKIYDTKLNSIKPILTVKKVMGWNAGIIKEKPWFSTCWEDKNGRIMMDILLSTNDIENESFNSIESICSSNDIYHLLSNFTYVPPYKDRVNFTYDIQQYNEGKNGLFYRVTLLLRESVNGPRVCDAEFYSIDSLNEFNKLTHIVEQAVENRISKKYRLDNEVLKTIEPEDIVLFYYNMANLSKQFIVVTKDKTQDKNHLKKVDNNIFIKQNDFVWYSGTYGTQSLLPDDLIAKFGLILDDNTVRTQCGNTNSTFALDGLFGECVIGNWITINDTDEHLIISPLYRDLFLDELDNRLLISNKKLMSNIETDFGECWKKIIQAYYKKEDEIQFKHIKSIPKIQVSNVIAFSFATSEAQGWPGLAQIVIEEKGSLSAFAIECGGDRNKKNLDQLKSLFPFLDSNKIRYLRDKQNSGQLEEYQDKLYTSFDFYRGGYNYYIPDTDWRWYDIGFGHHVFIQNKYKKEIFTRKKIEQAIKDLKLTQMHTRSIQEFCHVLVSQWKFFFDDYRKKFLDGLTDGNKPQEIEYTFAISINDKTVKKVLEECIKTGKYDIDEVAKVVDGDLKYTASLTQWMEEHEIISLCKDNKPRKLLFESYEDIKNKVKIDEEIEKILNNGFTINLCESTAAHLSTSASLRLKNGEAIFESVDSGGNVGPFFGGADSVEYTIKIDKKNTKRLLSSLGADIVKTITKRFSGINAKQKFLKHCDENGITYKENIWTDYD